MLSNFFLKKIEDDFKSANKIFDKTEGTFVTIFGSARTSSDNLYYKKSVEISKSLSNIGFNIITGGGHGIMEAANKGSFTVDGVSSIGFNIDLPFEQNINNYNDKYMTFNYFFPRKVMLVKNSLASVFFPGGFGTFDELFEVLTLKQTGKMQNFKIFLYGVEFFSPIIDFFKEKLLSNGLISKEDMDIFILTDDATVIVNESKKFLSTTIEDLEKQNLTDSKYYKNLKFTFNKNN